MKNIRRYIQFLFLGASVYLGVAFAIFLHKVKLNDFSMVKPGGVEAFLPISELMAFKRFILSGQYDWVHPAGLSLFIIFLIITIIYKRSFCGYVCPVGLISELVSSVGMGRKMNKYVAYVMSALKYILLAFFGYIILINMPLPAIEMFMKSPYNIIADAKMLEFFTQPGHTTMIFLVLIVALTLIYKGFWCRFVCPYGLFHSIFGMLSPMPVKRHKEACTNCMACTKACPMDIDVHLKTTVLHTDCIGCHECVRARTNENCLTVGKNFDMKKTAFIIGGAVVVMIIIAIAAGLWNSRIPAEEYGQWLVNIGSVSH